MNMKLIFKNYIYIGLIFANILSTTNNASNCCQKEKIVVSEKHCKDKCGNLFGKTFFSYRPQDSNVATRMVGIIDKSHKSNETTNYSIINLGLQYSQNYNSQKLAKFFSFTGNKQQSYGPTCNDFDIYGINFGTTSTGLIRINPVLKNFIVDVDIYNNWDECFCGLWTRFNIPFVYTRRDYNLTNCINQKGSTTFPTNLVTVGIDDGTKVPFTNLKNAFEIPIRFGSAPKLEFGQVHEKKHDAQIAGLHFEIGYDFLTSEELFFGAGLHFVAPTGTRPDAKYLFEPVCGANHCPQIGGTIRAGYRLWESCNANQSLSVYFDSVITHLFAAKQHRLFGLHINGHSSPGSSYLLLKKFDQNDNVIGLERAANLLACETKIKANVMADLALMFQYNVCNCKCVNE